MRNQRCAAALLLVACLGATAGRAAEDGSAVAFRRAELLERSLGDLEGAAALYREAARAAPDRASAARAELRQGVCLRRLGRSDDARTLLEAVAASGADVPEEVRRAAATELARTSEPPSAVTSPPATAGVDASPADPRRLAEAEQELEELRARLQDDVARRRGLEAETEELARRLRQKDAEIASMRAQLQPSSPEEALRVRIAEQERERQADRELSRDYSGFARKLHQEGRFADARDFLYVALEKDPENAEARALLARVSAPLGDRERLHEEVLGVLALAREVRAARATSEVDSLLAEAWRRQEREDHLGSVAPLERALAILDAGDNLVRAPDAPRSEVLRMLRAAESRGAQRAPAQPRVVGSPADADEKRWLDALRALLSSAGSEIAHGLELRFHDLDAALASAAAGLPPVAASAPPSGWTISSTGVAAAPLIVAYLRATEPRAFAAPGASVVAIGSTAAALLDRSAQQRLAAVVATLASTSAPSADLQVVSWRGAPGHLPALIERRGLVWTILPSGSRAARVPAAELEALLGELARDERAPLRYVRLRATPLRPFRMVAGNARSALLIDLLPVTGAHPGVGVRVAVEWSPPGRGDGARLVQEATAGAALSPGDGLVVAGLADPVEPAQDLAVIVRLGAARPTAPSAPEASAAGAPLPPPSVQGSRDVEILLPSTLAALHEFGPATVHVAGAPVPTREQAIAARIRAVGRAATLVEVKDQRVRVVGPEPAQIAARAFVEQIARVRGIQTFEVRMHQISVSTEEALVGALPKLTLVPTTSFAAAVLGPAERPTLDRFLTGARGELPLVAPLASAPPTGRADVARVVRSLYRRELDTAPGADVSWARSATAWVDEGILVAIRPFGRTAQGRVDADVSVRAAWIAENPKRRRPTPLGPVDVFEPEMSTSWGDLPVTLAMDETLVLAGMRSPFFGPEDRQRLVIVIRAMP